MTVDVADASKRLGIPPGLDRWLYVSPKGVALATGDLDSTDVANLFGWHTHAGRARAAQGLGAMLARLDADGAFRREHEDAATVPGGILNVMFINYACSGCQIADRLQQFQVVSRRNAEAYRVEVPTWWQSQDREILARNIGITLRTQVMSAAVAQALSGFDEKFGALNSNGFVVRFGPGQAIEVTRGAG